MNILITNFCNRRCPYCFAAARVSYDSISKEAEQKSRFISPEDFERALVFAAQSEPAVGILGGEPSLHPEFAGMIERTWAHGLDAKIFTNGIWSEKTVAAVERLEGRTPRNLRFIVNTNHPDITPEAERKTQQRLFSRLPEHCSLSFNIHSTKQEMDFLVDLIVNQGLSRDIRLGIAAPLAEQASEFIPVSEYPQLAPLIIELARLCDLHNVHLGFDCGFTLCMFTAEQLGLLQLYGADFRANCGPAIDVGTDLSVWACFPLATLSKPASLNQFEDHRQIVNHFEQCFEPLYRTGALTECLDCKHLNRGRCSGGCAAHAYRNFA